MKNIELIDNFEFGVIAPGEKNKEVRKIFDGTRRQLIGIRLRGGEVLAKHKATEPITVFCIAGQGTFRAGRNLEEEQKLVAGALITLGSDIDHELVADPEIHVLVTKFKGI